MRTPLLLASTILLLNSPILAQGARIVDEGSFTISVNGRTVGRENFRISSAIRGNASEFLANANVTYGDRRVTPELRAGGDGTVAEYSVTTKSGASTESWSGAMAGGRLNAQIASARGTAAREYIVPAGTIVLDDEIIHHHWFLALRSHSGSMPVVVPRRTDVKSTVTMETLGEEMLQIGNHDLQAVHLRASVGSGDVHDIWVDKSGRLLKVALPARNLVAVRDDPPRA